MTARTWWIPISICLIFVLCHTHKNILTWKFRTKFSNQIFLQKNTVIANAQAEYNAQKIGKISYTKVHKQPENRFKQENAKETLRPKPKHMY